MMCLPISSHNILRLLLSSISGTKRQQFDSSSAASLGSEASIQAPPVWPSEGRSVEVTEVTEVTAKSAGSLKM